MEGEEHDGAVGEVRDEVVVSAGCDGGVQEGGGALGGGSLHPVVVSQLAGEAEVICRKLSCI